MDSVMSVSKDTTLQLHKMVNSPSKSETRSARTELWEFEEGRPTALSGYKKNLLRTLEVNLHRNACYNDNFQNILTAK